MACLLIWVFTVDVQLTFCCETCEVSTLVGMTMHFICSILILGFYRCHCNINCFKGCFESYLKHYICKVAR